MIKLFFGNFRDFMGIYWIIKTLVFLPSFCCCQARSVDRTKSRPTVAVDRRARIRARWLSIGPADRTVDRLHAG